MDNEAKVIAMLVDRYISNVHENSTNEDIDMSFSKSKGIAIMYTFYVVVRHNDTGIFSSLNYKTENELLTENDLFKIDNIYAEKHNTITEIKTQIISWQRLN